MRQNSNNNNNNSNVKSFTRNMLRSYYLIGSVSKGCYGITLCRSHSVSFTHARTHASILILLLSYHRDVIYTYIVRIFYVYRIIVVLVPSSGSDLAFIKCPEILRINLKFFTVKTLLTRCITYDKFINCYTGLYFVAWKIHGILYLNC